MNIMGEIVSGWDFTSTKFDLGKLHLVEVVTTNKETEL